MSATGSFNANATAQMLADAVAMDPAVKAQVWARYLDYSSRQHDAFAQFESDVPRVPMQGSQKGIFARKRDLKAGGGDTVNFTVMSPPGGPGVIGEQQLTGKTSHSKFKTYKVIVDWHRDAVEFTRKQIEMMAGGKELEATTGELLKHKMGIWKQHEMMKTLMSQAKGNTYRPNNRASRDDIVATDRLSLSMCSAAKARLNTIGGRPIKQRMGQNGDYIKGFLIFATEYAMLDIRNEDGYQNAIAQGDKRGSENANFTGRLVDWQGMCWFEHIVADLDWDDYIGSPIQPKALSAVTFNSDDAPGDCVLQASTSNDLSRYFQWFPGYDYKFYEEQPDNPDNDTYYAWAVNPDGTLAFVSYRGSDNNGNQIDLANGGILADDAGGSGLGSDTVGEVTVAGSGLAVDGGSRVITPGADTNLPTEGWTYVDEVRDGAYLIPTNAKGVPIGHGFVFGAHAALRAYGRIEMDLIRQERDYGFVKGAGYQMIFGQSPCIRTDEITSGYLLLEFAIEHEGTPVPEIVS